MNISSIFIVRGEEHRGEYDVWIHGEAIFSPCVRDVDMERCSYTHTRVSRKEQKLRRGKFIIFLAAFGDSTAPMTTDVSNILASKTVRVNV